MKLRDAVTKILAEGSPPRPGELILSGVTREPGLCAAFLSIAEKHQERFKRAVRFHAGPIHVAVGSNSTHTVVVFRTPDLDEAEAAIIRAAFESVRRSFPPDDFPSTPAKWPSLLKKLSK